MEIYKTTNKLNDKFYIGKDGGSHTGVYLGSGIVLKRAIKKYGRESFIRETLEECRDLKHLSEREMYWIKKYDACKRTDSYNISTGGEGGDTFTYNPRYEELCRKVSLGQMGRVQTKETRKKISEVLKKSKRLREVMDSPEYKEKMSNALSGAKNPRSKLTEEQVIEILNKFKIGARFLDVAGDYDMSVIQVKKIVGNTAWKHIDREPFGELKVIRANAKQNS